MGSLRQIRIGRDDLDRPQHLAVLADLGDFDVLAVVAIVAKQLFVLHQILPLSTEVEQVLEVA